MKEKILRIEEGDFKKNKGDYNTYSGYLIITDQQTIKVGLDMMQDCCERPGYFMSEDDFSKFIGAEVIGIEITDTALNQAKIDEVGLYEGGIMFVDIKTDRGILQFVAYNEQNGYYGHEAIVISKQLEKEQCV